jgi:hypothetical protein
MWGHSSCINVLKIRWQWTAYTWSDACAHKEAVRYISLYINRRRVRSQADRQNTKDYKNQNSVVFFNALGTYYWFFHFVLSSSTFHANNPASLYGTLWFVMSPDHKVFISFLCKAMPTILHNISSNGVKDNKQMKNESNQPPTTRRHNGRTTHTNDIRLCWQYSWKFCIKDYSNTITSLTLWVEYRYIMMKQYTKLYLILSQLPVMCFCILTKRH